MREPGQYLECLLWKARATAVLEKPELRPRAAATGGSGEAEATADAYFRETGLAPRPSATRAMPSRPARGSRARR